jgi:hypothetical protein
VIFHLTLLAFEASDYLINPFPKVLCVPVPYEPWINANVNAKFPHNTERNVVRYVTGAAGCARKARGARFAGIYGSPVSDILTGSEHKIDINEVDIRWLGPN